MNVVEHGVPADRPWWERPHLLLLIALISAVPLLYPPIPPLVDLLGHMGRYRVELDIDRSPWLWRYYGFHWAAIGNIGVDVLVLPLGRLLGLEPAVKLIVMAIPPLTVAGFLWVAREVHGRVPPTALFALPFAYALPFLYGFVNFALSMALAFLAFGLWLRLARFGRFRVRAVLFVPISVIVFFTHVYGWGVLGLLCFSADVVRQHDRGSSWVNASVAAALRASVMAFPIPLMLAWRGAVHGGMTEGWLDWRMKLEWLYTVLRDRWKWLDLLSLALVLIVIVEARRRPEAGFSRRLAFSALLLGAVFLLLPWHLFGSAYADMRLVPYIFATALLAIRVREVPRPRLARSIAAAGLAFFLLRLASASASLAMAADDLHRKAAAIGQLPWGARVATLVSSPCNNWPLPRLNHIDGLVLERKQGFSNDQWQIEGANLLDIHYPQAAPFTSDPSEIVTPKFCSNPSTRTIETSLRMFPRRAFDYLWIIDPPPFDPALTAGMTPVWRGPGTILYKVQHDCALDRRSLL